ncbi:MerR family transcriptional regulator [Nocardia arthritidis]|uniref:MerR family transcriptional regulator n=1 Tax=Nocardia arthritidis TaxID=228602 RepID=A0A6G9YJ84_9NOCA|nr:MerR family transcriptional regulator [Nocardia arthritidis]QIS13248.1 MerR family transcriptional regulator [Nocardia arthritidis]
MSARATRRWRVTELARAAGVSEQQVRNYVDAGVLPPVERTAAGYRVFTDQHADALAAARAMAIGYGWTCTRKVLSAIHDDDLSGALAALDESHAELARERDRIAAALAAFTKAAKSQAPQTRKTAHIGQVAADSGVRTPVLRLWERRGLLRPQRDRATGYRTYDPVEQRAAHLVAVLRRGGFAFPDITAALDHLRTNGSVEKARTELARREHQVTEISLQRLRGSAALHSYLENHYV